MSISDHLQVKIMFLSIAILILAAGTSIALIFIIWRRRALPGAVSLFIFAVDLFLLAIAYFLFNKNVPPGMLPWLSLAYFCETIASTTLFTFAIEFIGRGDRLKWSTIILLVIEPVLTQILIWTDRWHGLFFAGRGIGIAGTTIPRGLWFWVDAIY